MLKRTLHPWNLMQGKQVLPRPAHETRASARLTSERLAVWATLDHEVAEPVLTGEQKS